MDSELKALLQAEQEYQDSLKSGGDTKKPSSTKDLQLEALLQAEKEYQDEQKKLLEYSSGPKTPSDLAKEIGDTLPSSGENFVGQTGALFSGAVGGAFDVLKGGAMLLGQQGAAEGLETARNAITNPIDNFIKEKFPNVPTEPAKFVGNLIPTMFATGVKSAAALGALVGAGTGEADQPYSETAKGAAIGASIPLAAGAIGAVGKGASYLKDRFVSPSVSTSEAGVSSLLDDIAPTGSVMQDVKGTAGRVIKGQGSKSSDTVNNLYQKIKDTTVNPGQGLDELVKDPQYGQIYQSALDGIIGGKISPNKARLEGSIPNSIQELDAVRRQLSNTIDKLGKPSNPNYDKEMAALYTGAKKKLTSVMDEAAPEFAQFRKLAGNDMATVDELKNTIIGKLDKASGVMNESNISKIFNPDKLEETVRWRDLITQQDPELWDKMSRSYISNKLNSLEKANTNARPADIIQGLMKTEKDRVFLQEVLKNNPVAQARFEVMGKLAEIDANPSLMKDFADVVPGLASEGKTGSKLLQNRLNSFLSGKYDKQLEASISKNKGSISGVVKDIIPLVTDSGVNLQISAPVAKGTAALGAMLAEPNAEDIRKNK